MKKEIEVIDEKIENNKNKIREFNSERSEIEKVESSKIIKYLTTLLKDNNVIEEEDEINGGRTSYSIYRDKEGYKKELFTLYYKKDSWNECPPSLELNYYTCGSTNEDFELNRLITLGKLACFLKENEPKMVEKISQISDKLNKESRDIYGEMLKVVRENEELKHNKNKLIDKQINIDISQGIKFTSSEVMVENSSTTIRGIEELKLIKLTPSGKTGTFLLKTKYNPQGETLKIRMSSILPVIKYYEYKLVK